MADMMQFPEQWEDFLHDYEFEDARRIYTNGSRLIPSFRVKQMMEHYAPVRNGRWVNDHGVIGCSRCMMGVERKSEDGRTEWVDLSGMPFCPACGARMDGVAQESSGGAKT